MGDPGFTFLADNFLGGTILFTDEQVGKYVRALCVQKLNGHLTFDELDSFAKGDRKVLSKFKVDDDGLYYNERLEREIKKREKFSKSQSEKARKKWGDNAGADAGASPGAYADLKAYALDDIDTDIETNTETDIESKKRKGKRRKKNIPKKQRDVKFRYGTDVLLTDDEYACMIDKWGEKYTKQAIEEYGAKFNNKKAAVHNHVDHNLGIRDYVRRGYLCQNLTPKPKEKQESTLPPKPPPEERATPDELKAIRLKTFG